MWLPGFSSKVQVLCYVEMKADFAQLPLLEPRTSQVPVCKDFQQCHPTDESHVGSSTQ